MPVHPHITDKIDDLSVPHKIRTILHEMMEAEAAGVPRHNGAISAISKMLATHADDPEIMKFCEEYA